LYYEAKKETLIMLYRHTLLTAEQLAVSLHYKPKTMHNITSQLHQQGLVRSIPLPFLKRNHVGYTLTAFGARGAASLVGDETIYRAKAWEAGPMQIEHYYGTNAFFADLIAASFTEPDEGLLEWLDPRSAAERYVQAQPGEKRHTPVKPDGFGMYRFADQSRLAFHLEYDTGTEPLHRLKEKLLQYGILLPTIWPKVETVHILFVTKIVGRAKLITDLWASLQKGTFQFSRLPQVWAVYEPQWKQAGLNGALWCGSEDRRMRLRDMPLLPPLADRYVSVLGKQERDPPPIGIRR